MKKYALIGKTLSHSYSPIIHSKIYKLINEKASYELLNVSNERLNDTINKLRTGEYDGFNVTIPYKEEVLKYLDEFSLEVKEIGSCNTIKFIDGKLVGFNTDYYGFIEQLSYYNIDVNNKRCYILGSGGSSKAIVSVINNLKGESHIVSRNKVNNYLTYDELDDKTIDVLINTTPVGMYPNISASPLSKDIAAKADVLIDIIFNPRVTNLMNYNDNSFNGLLMLIAQAKKACEIFFDQEITINYDEFMQEVEGEVYE